MICHTCEYEIFYYEVAYAFVKVFTQKELDEYQEDDSLLPQYFVCEKCIKPERMIQ